MDSRNIALMRPLLLVCLIFATPDARAERAIITDGFRIVVDPARIVLGDTASATVTLEASGTGDLAPPRVQASAGNVGALRRTGPRSWTASFTPPAESYPHVAMLSAILESGDQSLVGLIAMPLFGKGATTVRTKAKSSVVVFIGEDGSFGPVVADADGAARVAIVVPPGPDKGIARSRDPLGNESEKTIDLGVPAFNRLAIAPIDETVPSDGTASARVLAFVVDKNGEPLRDAPLDVSVGSAPVHKPEMLAPGIYLLRFQPVPGTKPGPVTLKAKLRGQKASTASTTIRVLTGAPKSVSLSSATTVLTADDPREVEVTAEVKDSAGTPVPFSAVRVEVDVGRIEEIAAAAGEARRMTWVLPNKMSATDRASETATLRVHTIDGAELGSHSLTLRPGKATRIAFSPLAPVVADGESRVDVVARVFDDAGNALLPRKVQARGSSGKIMNEAVRAGSDPALTFVFVPDAADTEAIATIGAVIDGAAGDTNLRLAPRPRPRLLVGPGVVSTWNYGGFLGVGPAVALLVRVPGLDDAFHVGVDLAVIEGLRELSAGTFTQQRAWPVLLEGAWRPLLLPDVIAHVGVQGGLAFSDIVIDDVRSIEPAAVGAVVGGIGTRAGPGFVELDVKAGYGLSLVPGGSAAPAGLSAAIVYRFGI